MVNENSERLIKKAIVKYIRDQGGFALCLQDRLLIGLPDVFAILDGVPMFIEVKSPRGKLSPSQDRMLTDINHHGVRAFMARSVDDVETALGNTEVTK